MFLIFKLLIIRVKNNFKRLHLITNESKRLQTEFILQIVIYLHRQNERMTFDYLRQAQGDFDKLRETSTSSR